ncbi:MAG: Gfo/Idh/MocA family oxidoreductase [Planctomycetia bacterium]|nr:Gfo/Idh/MocA family oxidoreductase [Planctomycetia bacterium]
MQQLTQQLKSGKMEILEVPFPSFGKGEVLVKNHYSVISAGTEGYMVSEARKGYIAKAKSRQKEVKQVIESIKTNGLISTYGTVMNKLEALSPLGYSCAGEVLAVGDDVTALSVGDIVACGGKNASHADIVAIPQNLCVKVPKSVDIRPAAFTTIAAIAIQGIRRAELEVGSSCVVIGLGLIGQITMEILQASGITPIGIDVQHKKVELALKGGFQYAYDRNQAGLDQLILDLTNGYGADAILITAGTSSLDPVEFAGTIARSKANVVILGAVPTGFNRDNYYNKELDLRMSTSYGPGRYDPIYEEKGIDYPIGYVRFTENRNMQTFIDLLESKKINIDYLITHEFELLEAPKAYKMILDKSEEYAGILITYDINKEQVQDVHVNKPIKVNPIEPNIGLVGAGNFAQNILLPMMKDECNFIAINTNHGNNSIYVAKKYGFQITYDSAEKVINDENTNTIFILTRHNTHAKYILDTIDSSKHIFVEKPLAITEVELESIKEKYNNSSQNKFLMVGFNRRFSPYIKKLKSIFTSEQIKAINIRVNAGILPADHWVNDKGIGGGRIIGEACHFIDLASFIADSKIESVFAQVMESPNGLQSTVNISLRFISGSIANISYFSNGSKMMPKELVEVLSNETSIVIDDFKRMKIYGRKVTKIKYKAQDKGHGQEITEFFKAIRNGNPCPIPFEESYHSSLVTFKTIQSIKENCLVKI